MSVWSSLSRGLLVLSFGLAANAVAEPEPKSPAPAPAASAAPPSSDAATTAEATNVAPAEAEPATAAEAPAAGPDLSGVRQELQSVLDELIQARTRVSALGKALFKTSLDVNVVRRADDQRLVRIVLSLDGVPVHDSDGKSLARDEAQLFHGFAAPGMHELTIETTEEARNNSAYRSTRSQGFRFEVRRDTHTKVEIVLRDASDLAEELPQGDEGELDVRTLVRVEAEEIERK